MNQLHPVFQAAIAPYLSRTVAVNPAAQFLTALQGGYCPTAEELVEICHAVHSSMVDADAPEMLWLDRSFEDMADSMTRAIRCMERQS